jgi:hypothetical protein
MEDVSSPLEPIRPFRWELVRRDQLGTLLSGCEEPSLWYLPELVTCAAKVLARCSDGDLYFVGRSLDSMYDLLGGALASTSWRDRLHLLPLSMTGVGDLPLAFEQLRTNLAAAGLAPADLARAPRPVVFVDLVFRGRTYEWLYDQLRRWADASGVPWPGVRRKLRFVGVTERTKNSPNTWRWQQQAAWTSDLPTRAIANVSLDPFVWSHLGDHQVKLTRSFNRHHWSDESFTVPRHDPKTRQALAEAVALVGAGRSANVRTALRQVIVHEPTFACPWLRSLANELRG